MKLVHFPTRKPQLPRGCPLPEIPPPRISDLVSGVGRGTHQVFRWTRASPFEAQYPTACRASAQLGRMDKWHFHYGKTNMAGSKRTCNLIYNNALQSSAWDHLRSLEMNMTWFDATWCHASMIMLCPWAAWCDCPVPAQPQGVQSASRLAVLSQLQWSDNRWIGGSHVGSWRKSTEGLSPQEGTTFAVKGEPGKSFCDSVAVEGC